MQFVTEHCSSASQITSAEVMCVISRLPYCDVWIRLPRHGVMGKHWRFQGTSLTKIIWSSISWIVMDSKNQVWNVCSLIENKCSFCQHMGMPSTWLEKKQITYFRWPYTKTVAMRWAILWTVKQESVAALQSQVPCLDHHQFKKKRHSLNQSEKCQKFAHKLS